MLNFFRSAPSAPSLTVPQAVAGLQSGAIAVIDVREADEFAAGHLQGAVHIPRGLLEFKLSAMPALQGRYFFSDFCTGNLMSFRLKDGQARDVIGMAEATASLGQVSSFGQDSAGELYMLTLDGTVSKLVAAAN